MSQLENKINQAWYQHKKWILFFYPLELLFFTIQKTRYFFYKMGWLKSWRAQVPVIIVGNILVGGTGKTPLVIALIKLLQSAGFNPGIITRGYGGSLKGFPVLVSKESTAREVGDEAILLFRNTLVPVVVDRDRRRSAKKIMQLGCDIIVSDDGLQHYALQRDIEIAVFDAQRKAGNEHLLPVGPLREKLKRLNSVDYIFINGQKNANLQHFNFLQPWKRKCFQLAIVPLTLVEITSKKTRNIHSLMGQKIHALVAIGNPHKFFQTLHLLGAEVLPHVFDDHHYFSVKDIPKDKLPIIVTEKDAVKIETLSLSGIEYLKISVDLPKTFKTQFLHKINQLNQRQINS